MRLATMVVIFVKQDVRECCPSTTRPLMPTIPSSLLAPGTWPPLLPVPRAPLSLSPPRRKRTEEGFLPLKSANLKLPSPLCFVWAGYLVVREVLWSFITLPRAVYFFRFPKSMPVATFTLPLCGMGQPTSGTLYHVVVWVSLVVASIVVLAWMSSSANIAMTALWTHATASDPLMHPNLRVINGLQTTSQPLRDSRHAADVRYGLAKRRDATFPVDASKQGRHVTSRTETPSSRGDPVQITAMNLRSTSISLWLWLAGIVATVTLYLHGKSGRVSTEPLVAAAVLGQDAAGDTDAAAVDGKNTVKRLGCVQWLHKIAAWANGFGKGVSATPHAALLPLELHTTPDQELGTVARMERGTLPSLVYHADVEGFRSLIQRDPSALQKRDPVGATPLHMMLLFNTEAHRRMACEVIAAYPERCADQYGPGDYEGENGLHIAVINGDVELVQLLVKACPELLTHRATGPFFQPGGYCYYGELPLSFAVCTGQSAMVRVLLDAGADLLAADNANGNSALHMAVLRDQPEMFDLLVDEWRTRGSPQPPAGPHLQCLSDLPNRHGQTALALAGECGSPETFDHILTFKGKRVWRYGEVQCTLYPFEGMDSGPTSALTYILERGRTEMMDLNRLRLLEDKKWESYGRMLTYKALFVHVGALAAFTVALVVPPPMSLGSLLHWTTALRWISELVVLCYALRQATVQVRLARRRGLVQHFRRPGAFALRNTTASVSSVAILTAWAARLCGAHRLEVFGLAVAGFTQWLALSWFMLAFKLTGPFVIVSFRMLLTDVPAFMFFISAFLGAFATTLYILREDIGLTALVGDFEACLGPVLRGSLDADRFGQSLRLWPNAANIVILLYFLVVALVMMRLLTAKFGETYVRTSQAAEKLWRLERGRVMCSIENSEAHRRRLQDRFAVLNDDGRPCFQVLEVDASYWREQQPQQQQQQQQQQQPQQPQQQQQQQQS